MGGYIYKPQTRKGPVWITPTNEGAPTIKLSDGRIITGVRGDQRGGSFEGHEGFQWVFDNDVLGQEGAILTSGGKTQTLGNSNQSYRGGQFGSLQESGNGAIGDTSGGPGGYNPGQVGSAFHPSNQESKYPTPEHGVFKPIKGAKYTPTDILKFATDFGEFNRGEMQKNRGMSKDIALDALNTELEGLQTYAPAASALKRSETNLDNVFNQSQRQRQVAKGLPGAEEDLLGQRDRANAFAAGGLPEGLDSNALEIGIRSRSADNSSAGGFGARSSVARKASELMSVESKIGLSQYGDQLLSSNVNQRANLFLAPTEYSNAGGQINVNPSFSAGQAQLATFSNLNANTTLSPGTALTADINQKQYDTSLRQQTQMYNSSGAAQMSLANANITNSFSQGLFQYQVGYAGAVAGAAQTDANTQLKIDQQKAYQEAVANGQAQVQSSQQTQAVGQAAGTIISGAGTILNAMGYGNSTGSTSSGGGYGTGGSSGTPVTGSGINTEMGSPPSSFGIGNGGSSGGGGYTSSTDVTPPGGFLNYGGDTGGGFSGTTSGGGGYQGGGSGGGESSSGGGGYQGGGSGGGESSSGDPGYYSSSLSSFNHELSQNVSTSGPQARSLSLQSNAVLSSTGISGTPSPESTNVGVDNQGKPVYSNTQLLKSSNTTTGTNMVGGLNSILEPFSSIEDKDRQALDEVARKAGDPVIAKMLDAKFESNDKKGFIDTLAENFAGEKGKEAANILYSGFEIAQNWGRMSGAQKSLAMASLGIQGFKTSTGENLGDKQIIPKSDTSPGLTVGQGLALFKEGINTYSLVKNWNQLNTLGKVAGVTQNVSQMAKIAKSYNLLGYGVSGASVPNVKEDALTQAGYTSSPSLGIGALTGKTGSNIPPGYSLVAKSPDTQVVAPTPNVNTTTPNQVGSLLNTGAGGAAGVSLSTKNVYQNWQKNGSAVGASKGAVGGSAMAAGLSKMGDTNPYILGSMVASTMMGDTAKNREEPFSSSTVTQNAKSLQGGVQGNQQGITQTSNVQNDPRASTQSITQYNTKTNDRSKNDQTLKDTINITKAVVDAGNKLGSETTGAVSPYVNIIAAGEKVYSVLNNPNATDKQKAEAVAAATQTGVNVAANLGNTAAGKAAPYINTALAAYNASKILSSDMTDEQKAKAIRRTAEDTAAAYYTLGISSLAQYVDSRFLGGKGEKLRSKIENFSLGARSTDFVTEKVLGAIGSKKSGAQQGRDQVRSYYKKTGLANSEYKITLADGTQADIGIDGHGGQHGVSDPSKLTKDQAEMTKLNSWDTDYTNDLDYSSGTVGIAITRMLTGGKGRNIDQVGSQLGNAMLGNIGYGKEFSPENFSKLTSNMRAVYAQSGIKSKADAYQLINQGFAEGRWTESDTVGMHMAANMAFDRDGYDSASKLMAGRFTGIETAGGASTQVDGQYLKPLPQKIPQSPGLGGTGPEASQVNYSPDKASKEKAPPPGPGKDSGYSKGDSGAVPKPLEIDQGKDRGFSDYSNLSKKALMSRTKEDAVAKNRQRYSRVA